MRVTIPDPLADQYQAYATQQGIPLDAVVTKQLTRVQSVTPGSRVVILGANHLDYLAEKLHGGDVQSAEDLLQKVDRLAGIKFEAIDLKLTPAQLEEVQHRAERQGKSVDQLVHEMWAFLSQELLRTPVNA